MHDLNATGKLFGEVIALRIVLQRLLAQLAAQTEDFEATLRHEHIAALDDLSRMKAVDDDADRAQAILMHAEQVIDQMHTIMRQRP